MKAERAEEAADVTVGETVSAIAARFAEAGFETPRLDARVLAAFALGIGTETVFSYPERRISSESRARIEELAERRLAREPVSRIVGEREFWSLPFEVDEHTLVPRPESETLIEAVLDVISDREAPLRVLDLGTGSGCLLLAMLSELPGASGVGIDISDGSILVAARNAKRLGLSSRAQFVCYDWERITKKLCSQVFDVVLCNPPYIADGDFDELAPEVASHDPRRALSGGKDGLAAYRSVFPVIAECLAPGGVAAVELGAGQAPVAASLADEGGLEVREAREDLSEIARCLVVGLNSRFGGKKTVGMQDEPL